MTAAMRGAAERAEVVVVGGGHNGLTAAAFLAKAGRDVLLLEARASTGGCASTVDAIGTRVNICNCDHLFVRATDIHGELDLASHGLRYVELDPSYLSMCWSGGTPWYHFHDTERTLDGLARTHPSQVEGYRRYLRDMLPVARLVVDISTGRPTLGQVAPKTLRRGGRGVARLLTLARRSAVDVLRDYFDDDDLVRPALITGPVVWGLDPHAPGTGLAALGYATKHVVAVGRPVGGSGALTDALRASVEAHGGRVRCETLVDEILLDGDRAVGVRTSTGDEIAADQVVAACDPEVVMVDWLRSATGSAATKSRARWSDAEQHDGYESKIDAVIAEPPVLQAAVDLLPDVDPAWPTMLIGPDLDELSRAHVLAGRGVVAPRPVMMVNAPSVPDPSMRDAEGNHLLSLEVLWTPYALDGGWPDSSEPARWLEQFSSLVQPGWLDGVGDWRVMTPVDYEEQFMMRRGYAPSWSGTPLSALLGRPKERTRYRTDIDGLFLCGAGTFPGAGVWGVSGRNVAEVVTGRR